MKYLENCFSFSETFRSFLLSNFVYWNISVICFIVVLKLTVAVFISLYFQTFWLKWLNFFWSFQNRFGISPKKKIGKTNLSAIVYLTHGWSTTKVYHSEILKSWIWSDLPFYDVGKFLHPQTPYPPSVVQTTRPCRSTLLYAAMEKKRVWCRYSFPTILLPFRNYENVFVIMHLYQF